MGLRFPARLSEPSRRWMIVAGAVLLQLLLMGSAFVGGRMLGDQNGRRAGGAGFQLPSQLPRTPSAGSGSVQKIQDNVFTITPGFGGFGGGNRNSSSDTTPVDVATSAATKFYLNSSAGGGPGGPGFQGGGQVQVTVADATLADVKVGNNVIVWGVKNGARITADVVYIQSGGR